MVDDKEFIQLINMQVYIDKIQECRVCKYRLQCRGASVYEPECPVEMGFNFEPIEN